MFAFLSLLAFVAFMVGTPGPANLIVMLAGVRQGLRQSFSFILGLIVGKVALNLFIGFGFGLVLAEAPVSILATPSRLHRIISGFVTVCLFIR